MAITIISPEHSFVRFGDADPAALCLWGTVNFNLPVFEASDWYFQWVIQGTELEIDSLCRTDGEEITVKLVDECEGSTLMTFSEKPQRIRLSATQVLYNWAHGFPNFTGSVAVGQCFRVQLDIEATPYGYPDQDAVFCSNKFERIGDDCYTSVIDYTNDEDAFGFKYCNSGNMEGAYSSSLSDECEPLITQFINQSTLQIPYTAQLKALYGDFPTVQVWIFDGTGQLVNMGISASFDTYPPTMISFDFGGPASGLVVLR